MASVKPVASVEAKSEADHLKQPMRIDTDNVTRVVREEIAKADVSSLRETQLDLRTLLENNKYGHTDDLAILEDLDLDIDAALTVASSLPTVTQTEWSTWPQLAPTRYMTNEEAINAHFSDFANGDPTTGNATSSVAAQAPLPAPTQTIFDSTDDIVPLTAEAETVEPSRFTQITRKLGAAAANAMHFLHRGGGASAQNQSGTFLASEKLKEERGNKKKTLIKVLGGTAIAVAALVLTDKELDIIHFDNPSDVVRDQIASIGSFFEGHDNEVTNPEAVVTVPDFMAGTLTPEATITITVPATVAPSPTTEITTPSMQESPTTTPGNSIEITAIPTQQPTKEPTSVSVEPTPSVTSPVIEQTDPAHKPAPASGEGTIVNVEETPQETTGTSSHSAETSVAAPETETAPQVLIVCENYGFTDLILQTRPDLSKAQAYEVYRYLIEKFGPNDLIVDGIGVYQMPNGDYGLTTTGETRWAPGVEEEIRDISLDK